MPLCDIISNLVINFFLNLVLFCFATLEINKLNTKDKSERIKFGRLNVINELKNSPVGLSSSMQVLILNGIAYHHGGTLLLIRN